MNSFLSRGYMVKETAPVYYSSDMDNTVNWFKEKLCWYGVIDERDENGNGTYGCVFDIPVELERLNIGPWRGIHLLKGEPVKALIIFVKAEGIDNLYSQVRKAGWDKISEPAKMPWGSRILEIETPDGCKIRFFE